MSFSRTSAVSDLLVPCLLLSALATCAGDTGASAHASLRELDLERCRELPTAPTESDDTAPPHVFGLEGDREVLQFFRDHRVAVSAFTRPLERAGDSWTIALEYPSYNHGGEDGSDVLYSHVVPLLASDERVELLEQLDPRRVLLVLQIAEGSPLGYRWVGCAPREADGPAIDWFAERRQLLFAG
ncbi:MAG: hypothetical protein DWQ36_07125 [Acidobacteria bacterium]|nr:MAG: hypothetical protein DWQ30_24560 [Acidobacteriota bacterium]REK09313.1 MAG: hypothetical protein DWQ36_07125 [Acidobacteriota bacterium]